jgi:hypothetical protein
VVGAGPPDEPGQRGWLDRLELAALDRAPGRLARAARIALGRVELDEALEIRTR